MKISELSQQTDTSVATLKFYLREGLLHPGEATARTRATYDDSHVRRVRLIRALSHSAGLSIKSVGALLTVLDDPPASRHLLLGAAQLAMRGDLDAFHALLAPQAGEQSAEAPAPEPQQAQHLMNQLGWDISPTTPGLRDLEDALSAATDAGVITTSDDVLPYAHEALSIAELDLARTPEDPTQAVSTVILGTALMDPILATLRRLAQQHCSAQAQADLDSATAPA